MKILSILGYLLMVVGILGFIFTRTLFSPFVLTVVLQVAALLLMFWARKTLGMRSFHLSAEPTKGVLITNGPYKYIRHPIYAAVCLFVLASVIGSISFLTLLFALVVISGSILRIFCEEKSLLKIYPEYADYSQKTKRLIPYVF